MGRHLLVPRLQWWGCGRFGAHTDHVPVPYCISRESSLPGCEFMFLWGKKNTTVTTSTNSNKLRNKLKQDKCVSSCGQDLCIENVYLTSWKETSRSALYKSQILFIYVFHHRGSQEKERKKREVKGGEGFTITSCHDCNCNYKWIDVYHDVLTKRKTVQKLLTGCSDIRSIKHAMQL